MILFLTTALLGCDPVAPSGDDSATPAACLQTPVGKVSLPGDDTVHSEPIEWWYWTGHVKTADGKWYGFEHVFFSATEGGMPGVLVHTAVTDIDAGVFHHGIKAMFSAPDPVANGFSFAVQGETADGGNGHDVIHGATSDTTLDLTLDAQKAPVLQHGDGYKDYDFGGYTWYYSREHLAAIGTLDLGQGPVPVTGTAWFDHQWGSLGDAVNAGWDWFALQLDDGTDIMLFNMRPNGVSELEGGSISDAACHVTTLAPGDVTITSTGTWTSPTNGCVYPAGWTVDVGGKHLVITPLVADQELPDAQPIYWEGASSVTGDATGRAYVELTGYCGGF